MKKIISMICLILMFSIQINFAADDMSITLKDTTKSEVIFDIGKLNKASKYEISYYNETADLVTETVQVMPAGSELKDYTIDSLKSSHVYNITATAYDVDDNMLAIGAVNGITEMNFVGVVSEEYEINTYNEKETGKNPRMELIFDIPQEIDDSDLSDIKWVFVDPSRVSYRMVYVSGLPKTYYIRYDTTDSKFKVYDGNGTVITNMIITEDFANAVLKLEIPDIEASSYYKVSADMYIDGELVSSQKVQPQYTDNTIQNIPEGNIATYLKVKIGKDLQGDIICSVYPLDNKTGGAISEIEYQVHVSTLEAFTDTILKGYYKNQEVDDNAVLNFYIANGSLQDDQIYFRITAKVGATAEVYSSIIKYDFKNETSVVSPFITQNLKAENINVRIDDDTADIKEKISFDLSWDKPAEIDSVKDILSYNLYISEYPSNNYEKVMTFSPDDTTENGNKLEYSVDSEDLENIQLKSNKIYKIKIQTAVNKDGVVKYSDYSLPITVNIPAVNKEMEAVSNLLVKNVGDDFITLEWDASDVIADVNYGIYYDVYIGNASDDMMLLESDKDIKYGEFEYIDDKIIYTITNSDELNQNDVYINPNTIYYLKVRARKENLNSGVSYDSDFSKTVSVTTLDKNDGAVNTEALLSRMPKGFMIKKDAHGDDIITAYSVTLRWDKLEETDKYFLVKTDKLIDPKETLESILATTEYHAETYEITDANYIDGEYVIVIKGLMPNQVYYFNVASQTDVGFGQTNSFWSVLPVTTRVVEAPKQLQYTYDSALENTSQVRIKWIGDEKATFEFQIKKEGDKEYTSYIPDSVTSEKTQELAQTANKEFSAIIKGLDSNCNYDVKIRGKRVNESDPTIIDYSNYSTILRIRTDFSQSDYNKEQNQKDNRDKFEKEFLEFNKNLYWRLQYDKSYLDIKIKEKEFSDYIRYDIGDKIVLDLSEEAEDAKIKNIYIPVEIMKEAYKSDKALEIKTQKSSVILRKNIIDFATNTQYSELFENVQDEESLTEDLWVKVVLKSGQKSSFGERNGYSVAGEVMEIELYIIEMYGNEEDFKEEVSKMIEDIKEDKLEDLDDEYKLTGKEADEEIAYLLEQLEEEIGEEINEYIEEELIKKERKIDHYDSKILVKHLVAFEDDYVYTGLKKISNTEYDVLESWKNSDNTISYEVDENGVYGIFKSSGRKWGMSTEQNQMLQELEANYGIYDIAADNGSFSKNKIIDTYKFLELIEAVAGDVPSDIYISDKMTREEMAYILALVYQNRSGISFNNYSATNRLNISDSADINKKYYKAVVLILDLGIMELDSYECFNPSELVTNYEALEAIANLEKAI